MIEISKEEYEQIQNHRPRISKGMLSFSSVIFNSFNKDDNSETVYLNNDKVAYSKDGTYFKITESEE